MILVFTETVVVDIDCLPGTLILSLEFVKMYQVHNVYAICAFAAVGTTILHCIFIAFRFSPLRNRYLRMTESSLTLSLRWWPVWV